MAKKVKADAQITTTSSHKTPDGTTDNPVREETVPVPVFSGEPARVTFEAGMTVNLGNYESAKVSVGVVLPCNPTETDAAFETAKEWATSRLIKETKAIKEFVASRY